jgi:hypothetical protein
VHDCYDKRHPQEAVRDKGWECGGDGAQGTGLDWNGAGRLARPDVDPLSFIQEPNDAYFTTIPQGTFGDYQGEEVIWTPDLLDGLLIWVDPQKEEEIFTDIARTSSVEGKTGQLIASIDQTNYNLNDYLEASDTAERAMFYRGGFNGKNIITIQDRDRAIGGHFPNRIPYKNMTLFYVTANWQNPAGVSGYPSLLCYNPPNDFIQTRYPGFRDIYWSTDTTIHSVGFRIPNHDYTDAGMMFTFHWDATDENNQVRFAQWDFDEDGRWYSSLNVGGDNYYDYFWVGNSPPSSGFGGTGSMTVNVLEVIYYERVLSEDEVRRVHDYLNEKYSLGFSR